MMLLFLIDQQKHLVVMQLVWLLFMFVSVHKVNYWRLYSQGNNYIMMNHFWNKKLKVVMTRVNEIKKYINDITVSALLLIF